MEHGYFHPDRGYWQTTDAPSQNILDGYPLGTAEILLRPAGDFNWDGLKWAEQPPDLDAAAAVARGKRGKLLATSDWTQVADAPVNKTAWAAYRQELRDITEQAGFPININWPTKPE